MFGNDLHEHLRIKSRRLRSRDRKNSNRGKTHKNLKTGFYFARPYCFCDRGGQRGYDRVPSNDLEAFHVLDVLEFGVVGQADLAPGLADAPDGELHIVLRDALDHFGEWLVLPHS